MYSILCVFLLLLLSQGSTLPCSAHPVKVAIEADSASWFRSLSAVHAQIGVREATGRNDGPMVKRFLQSVNLREGNPWCYALQYWGFYVSFDKPPMLRTGLVRAAWHDAVRRGTVVPYVPEIGDLIAYGYPRTTSGHIERIDSVGRAGWVRTDAGNTIKDGARGSEREGGGAYHKWRNVLHPLGKMYTLGLIGRKHERTM